MKIWPREVGDITLRRRFGLWWGRASINGVRHRIVTRDENAADRWANALIGSTATRACCSSMIRGYRHYRLVPVS